MKRSALPSRLEAWVQRAVRRQGESRILRWTYETAVSIETLAATFAVRRPVQPIDPGNVTLAVKTFERPESLRRMLASVRRVYSGPVIVADDSETPFVSHDPLIRVLALPFDTGVGAGRNALIDAVTTKYLWMADDDMILLPDFDLGRILGYLEAHPEVDLCGGRVVNLPLWESADYLASPLFAHAGKPRRPQGMLVGGLPVHYKVPNFYVARRESLESVRYDGALKRVDHTDFFTSAYGSLLSVQDPQMVCLHAKSYFDPHYRSFRSDTAADLAYLTRKWPQSNRPVHGAPDHLEPEYRSTFHHAAVEVVANDLGVAVVHTGAPDDDVATVVVAEADLTHLLAALRSLGWSGAGTQLHHPLWGRLAATSAPTRASEAVPASFGCISGLAATPGLWPAPVERGEGPNNAGRWVRWNPRAAWVDTGSDVLGAPLPLGPVTRLLPPGDLIWEVVGPLGAKLEEIITDVLDAFDEVPDHADDHVRDYLTALEGLGLLECAGE